MEVDVGVVGGVGGDLHVSTFGVVAEDGAVVGIGRSRDALNEIADNRKLSARLSSSKCKDVLRGVVHEIGRSSKGVSKIVLDLGGQTSDATLWTQESLLSLESLESLDSPNALKSLESLESLDSLDAEQSVLNGLTVVESNGADEETCGASVESGIGGVHDDGITELTGESCLETDGDGVVALIEVACAVSDGDALVSLVGLSSVDTDGDGIDLEGGVSVAGATTGSLESLGAVEGDGADALLVSNGIHKKPSGVSV